MAPGETENQLQVFDGRIPSAMKARPKIPRTPIPLDKLEQVKKQNEEILRNAVYIQKNEGANKKKQIARQQPPSELPKHGTEDEAGLAPAPEVRAKLKSKAEDRKGKELRKEVAGPAQKRRDEETTAR